MKKKDTPKTKEKSGQEEREPIRIFPGQVAMFDDPRLFEREEKENGNRSD